MSSFLRFASERKAGTTNLSYAEWLRRGSTPTAPQGKPATAATPARPVANDSLESQRRLFDMERQRLIEEQKKAQAELQKQFQNQIQTQAGRFNETKVQQENFISQLQQQNSILSQKFQQQSQERERLAQEFQKQQQMFQQERTQLNSAFNTQSQAEKQSMLDAIAKREQQLIKQFEDKEQGFLTQLEQQRNTLTGAFDDKLGQANARFESQLGRQREELTSAFGVQRESLEREISQLTDLSKTQEQRIGILGQAQNRATQQINDNIRDANSNVLNTQLSSDRRRRLLSTMSRQRGTAQTNTSSLVR